MKSLEEILKQYWGYDSFRPLQREVIESVIYGRDTLALMPTGGGKSITFQLPALALDGLCLVITPLISLMKDQVDALRRKNILALSVHGGMSKREIDRVLDNCLYGDYKFLYLSPERLESEIFKNRFARMNVSMIAVDEAHCISQWGYDFRPSYTNIAKIRELAPDAPILAVTATATPEVVEDIKTQLGFTNSATFRMSFARKNLSYLVREVDDKLSHIMKVVGSLDGSGIIYCRTRKDCEELSALLNNAGVASQFYHGGLSYPLRSARQEMWLKEEIKVVVATNAFGMGIDKQNVRFVIHYQMPDSIEAYYQEAGRAGRDGKNAYAVLLVKKGDVSVAKTRIDNEYGTIEQIKEIYSLLHNYYQIGIGYGAQSTFEFDVFDFATKFKIFSTKVFSAIRILELAGYMTLTEAIERPSRIMFTVSREELYRITIIRDDIERFVSLLLRIYTGLFSQLVYIDENYIAHASGYTVEYVKEAFKKLRALRVLTYIPGKDTPLLIFHHERLDTEDVRIPPQCYTWRKDNSQKRLDAMVNYVEETARCRSLIMQSYFGDDSTEECGKCDWCRAKKGRDNNTLSKERVKRYIIEQLGIKPWDAKQLMINIKVSSDIFTTALSELIAEEKVEQGVDGVVCLK